MVQQPRSDFAIKTQIPDLQASSYSFQGQKTMYCGKMIAVGSIVYIFDSENQGGRGLLARGRVVAVEPVEADRSGPRRPTPRVSVDVDRLSTARERLGRLELKPFTAWDDGRPETELNFKLYRQATNKIVGLTTSAAAFIEGRF